MTLFTDVLYHKSNLGDFRYKFKMPGDEGGTARCSVTVKESYGVKGEDVTLALLSFYGYQCLSYWDAIETVYGPAKSEVQKN
jgi:hypothetical protein